MPAAEQSAVLQIQLVVQQALLVLPLVPPPVLSLEMTHLFLYRLQQF
jgi:hypothetical protein